MIYLYCPGDECLYALPDIPRLRNLSICLDYLSFPLDTPYSNSSLWSLERSVWTLGPVVLHCLFMIFAPPYALMNFLLFLILLC